MAFYDCPGCKKGYKSATFPLQRAKDDKGRDGNLAGKGFALNYPHWKESSLGGLQCFGTGNNFQDLLRDGGLARTVVG